MKIDTNSITNAQRYLQNECPPEARPYIRSLLEVISALKDANRLLNLDREGMAAEMSDMQDYIESMESP